MRLRAVLLLVAVFASSSAPGAVRAAATTSPHAVRAATTADAAIGPLVSGTGRYADGAYVWTDYAYDDKLASYPSGSTNGADLIQLQLSLDEHGDLHIQAVLETLTDAGVPLLAVGIDTDANTATGASHFTGMAGWLAAGDLGIEREFLIDAAGTRAFDFDASGHDATTLGSVVDPASNTISATIPAALASLHGSTARVYAAVGLRNLPTIFDLAFVGGEPATGWQTARQQAAASASGSVLNASAMLDLDAMRARATTAADASAPGFHTFLYRSKLNLAEGIPSWNLQGPGGAQLPLGSFYAGPYQPYIVWMPDRPLPEHPPLVVYMHGLQGTHTSNVNTLGKGLIDPAAVVVMPLGRGEDSFYEREAEQDILDVTDDAIARFDVDEDRVVLAGISMGGFGAFRLGILYPDRWSAIVPLIGTANSAQFYFGPAAQPQAFSPSGFPSGAGEMMENLANVPIRMVNGQVDPIVNNAFVTADTARLTSLMYDFKSWVLLRRQHEVVPAITGCVFDEAVAMRRARPAHIVFSHEKDTDAEDGATGLHLLHDSAYWVRNVFQGASPVAAKATVDVVDLTRADRATTATPSASAGENFSTGGDLCGTSTTVRTQDAWRAFEVRRARGEPQPVTNGLSVDMTNTPSIELDLAGSAIDPGAPVTIATSSDSPAFLNLRAAWPGREHVLEDGVAAAYQPAPRQGVITVHVATGAHVYTLSPA